MDHSRHQVADQLSFWERLQDSFSQFGFMPHGHCYLWKPLLVSIHVISDLLIGLAYLSISLTLYVLVKRINLSFNRIVVCFGVFIGACGLTHFMEIWNLWNADYWWGAWIKLITAAASVGTCVYLVKLKNPIVSFAEAVKQSEQLRLNILESGKVLQTFFDNAPMLMGVCEIVGNDIRHLSDNKAAASFFGTSPELTKGKFASELGAHANVTQEWIKNFKEAEISGEAKRFDYWHDTSRTKLFLSATVNFIGKSEEDHSRFSYVVQDITYLKSVETELLKIRNDLQKEVEERAMKFQSLANSISQLAWMTDGTGYISWYNHRWYDYTGTTLEEMQGWGWEKVHHPDHTKRVTENWEKHLESGEPWEDTFPLKGKNGEYRWFLSRAQPTYNESGKIVHWFGTNTDITEQLEALAKAHEAEAELSRSKSQLEAIFQAMSDGISLFDMNWNLIYLNEAQAKIYGFSNKEEMKRNLEYFAEIYELRDLDDVVVESKDWPISRVFRGESLFDLRLKGIRKDIGKEWYFSFSGEPIRDSQGMFILGLIITRDITIETNAQESLQQSQNLTRTITDNAASCLFMMDKNGHPSFMNPAAKRVTGYNSIEEIKDKPLHYAVHWKKVDGSYYPMEECPIDNAQAKLKEIRNGEEIFCRKDGTLFPVSFSVSPLEKDGEVIGSVLEFRDITEEKRAKDALQEALRARDEFLSIASHELKTPLTSLMMQAQMHKRMIEKGDERAFERSRIEGLISQTERLTRKLNRLVEDMLDISRIRSGKLTIQKGPCDLEIITLDVLNRFKNQFSGTDYKEPVFKGKSVIGNWDILRIEQVVTNLVSNALKYGDRKPVKIEIEDLGNSAQLKICDEGLGISKEDSSRIFGRFERAVDPNEASGLGLGLFISSEIVRAHGGKIWVESELGKGSTFFLELPKG